MLNKDQTLSKVIFLATFSLVAISSVSIIFPAFVVTVFSGSITNINPFERGVWAVPFIIINLAILDFALFYYYKKLPSFITNAIKQILEFEISKTFQKLTKFQRIKHKVLVKYSPKL